MKPNQTPRHFACTACGKCCTRGPEMELTEATALAETFITRVILKLHSLPLDARKNRAMAWWKRTESALPVREALDEARAHITRFAVRNEIDKKNKRTLHLTVSALSVHAAQGACPALEGTRCGVYETRPLSCRTTPFHYSRPASTLPAYLDRFTKTSGYLCDTSDGAPVVLRGGDLAGHDDGAALAQSERLWKEAIAALLGTSGLPSYDEVVRTSDAGGATTLSMSVGWRIAVRLGVMSEAQFTAICRAQLRLLRAESARNDGSEMLRAMLSEYERICSDRTDAPDQLASCLA